MMKSKEVHVAGDSENEFEVDDPEEVDSENEWAPASATKKRGRPSKTTAPKKKKAKVTDDDEDDEEEILPKKGRGSKPKAPTPTKSRGRPAKNKVNKKEEEPVVEPDEEEELDDEDEELDDEEEDDVEEEEEEEELNQGPNAKPAKKFTSGAFVVLKTDMIDGKDEPPVWKIDGKALLQKYIPFEQDGKLLYKNTSVYSGWGSNVKEQYYSAPVSFIQQTRKEHIIEFYKEQIQKDPNVEVAAKKEMEEEEEEAELEGVDEEEEDEKEEQDEA